MVDALRHDFDRQRVAQLPTPQGRPARGAVVAGVRILRVHDVEHVLAPVERPRIVQHPPGEAEEVVERGVRPLERVGLFLRGDAPHLAQRGDVRPRLVGQMGVVRALDENTQAAHFVRVREFGHLFPLELSGPVDRQGVVVIGPHRQMAMIYALVTLQQHALDRAARRQHVFGQTGRRGVRPARGDQDRAEVADLDAVVLPAEIEIPAQLQAGRRVRGVERIGGERLAGYVVQQAAVFGQARLAGEFLRGFEIVLPGRVVAGRHDLERRLREPELFDVARRQKRSQLLQVGLGERIAGLKVWLGVAISFDPIEHGLPGHGAAFVLCPARAGPQKKSQPHEQISHATPFQAVRLAAHGCERPKWPSP